MPSITPGEYVSKALRTESPITPELLERLTANARLLHALMGLATEVGEKLDALKRHIYYGAPLDRVNLVEESGDFFWYMALLSSELPFTWEHVMHTNIAKLEKRYKEKQFNAQQAVNRDLNAEREVLESPYTDKFWPFKTQEEKEEYKRKNP